MRNPTNSAPLLSVAVIPSSVVAGGVRAQQAGQAKRRRSQPLMEAPAQFEKKRLKRKPRSPSAAGQAANRPIAGRPSDEGVELGSFLDTMARLDALLKALDAPERVRPPRG
ncbi:MAG: hypothetical protein JWQ89_1767 [Devosia sp.]|nr:hypothetical protein [Devosia sp.]